MQVYDSVLDLIGNKSQSLLEDDGAAMLIDGFFEKGEGIETHSNFSKPNSSY